jgi:hypothetical protein
MSLAMNGTSACSGASDPQSDSSAIYQAAIAKRAQDTARVNGANAVRLIENAAPSSSSRPMPEGATISVRA